MAKRIGLFGGTFDPVHKGHQSIAKAFLQSGFIDELWILLTPYPPHKLDDEQASFQLRFEMLKAAFKNMPDVEISTVENTLPKPSYSIQTIRYLKSKHPDYIFLYCMGEDSLAGFNSWRHYEEILKECELLVAQRPGETHKHVEEKILNRAKFVDHSPLDISSTEIRESLQHGKQVENVLPEEVLKIIEKEQLYS